MSPAEQALEAYRLVLDERRRLTRELDLLINGEKRHGDSSLLDLVGQVRAMVNMTQGRPAGHVPAAREEYAKARPLPAEPVAPCPCCGGLADVWEHRRAGSATQRVVMCGSGTPIGPREDGCPFFTPPIDFYCPTAREAVLYWNAYAEALSRRAGVITAKREAKAAARSAPKGRAT